MPPSDRSALIVLAKLSAWPWVLGAQYASPNRRSRNVKWVRPVQRKLQLEFAMVNHPSGVEWMATTWRNYEEVGRACRFSIYGP